MSGTLKLLMIVVALSWLAACTTHVPYRVTLGAAPVDCTPFPDRPVAADCRQRTPEHTSRYDLFFVEFDDQGWLHPQQEDGSGEARQQLDFLMKALRKSATENAGISLVLYVHGWKHNAAWDDPNVNDFRNALLATSLVEESNEQQLGVKARRVIGVYVGWRGKSLNLPEPFISSTFWDRKFTAQHVAQGSARELFSSLRGLQRDQNAKDPACQRHTSRCKVRMLMIGHSFGGLILFNAISEALIDSLAADQDDGTGDGPVGRFGDMVILINPAFEASRYETLHRIATNRGYGRYQAPIFVSVTSTADWATRVAFPLGRFFNTIFEHTASEDENLANNNTIGHIPRYITHRLSKSKESSPHCAGWVDLGTLKPEERLKQLEFNLDIERRNNTTFFDTNLHTGVLRDRWSRTFCGGALLEHTHHDPNSPIWNIQTDQDIIAGHNEITGPVFANFIRQLYHDSVTYPLR